MGRGFGASKPEGLQRAAERYRVWDARNPGWRKPKPPMPRNPATDARIIEQGKAFMEAARLRPTPGPPVEDPEALIIQRFIPAERGKWRMFSADVEAAEKKRRGEERARR